MLVAGAGLAGLSAARALESLGARATVVDARERVGGRVWTIRDSFRGGQHAEAGADLIDSEQHAVVNLAKDMGLRLVPILKRGFGYCGANRRGRVCIQSVEQDFRSIGDAFDDLIDQYRLSERRWDSAITRHMARQSVADWLNATRADEWLKSRLRGLRGFFLADPEDLSLLALVDFIAEGGFGSTGDFLRIEDGNDRLATEMARRLRSPVRLRTILRRVRQQDGRVTAALDDRSGLHEVDSDYLIAAMPATTLRDVEWSPPLPDPQRDAIARLRYGSATRLLVQFAERFWKQRGRPDAFGSDQPTGAIWDGNEQQKGRPGILSFLAGGSASRELQAILQAEGLDGVTRRLIWLGAPAEILASRTIVWEDDPLARGGYCYFDPSFDPMFRDWLARPAGRIAFAGEHTSIRWQGYLNGAVESGQRAAAEVAAMQAMK